MVAWKILRYMSLTLLLVPESQASRIIRENLPRNEYLVTKMVPVEECVDIPRQNCRDVVGQNGDPVCETVYR